jgi:hypothetical protein
MMKKQSKKLDFDPCSLGSAATLLDVVAWYARRLLAAGVQPTLPNCKQLTLLDCAAAYGMQLAKLQKVQLQQL